MEGVVVSDGNAASNITRFYTAEEGLLSLDFQKVFAEWWNADDYFEKEEKNVSNVQKYWCRIIYRMK